MSWSTGGDGSGSRWRGGYNTTPDTGTLLQRSSMASNAAAALENSRKGNTNDGRKASASFVTRGATILFALGVATILASYSDNVSIVQQARSSSRSPVARFLRAMSAAEDQPLLKYYHVPGSSLGDQMFAWSSTVACAKNNAMFPCTFYSEMDDNAKLLRTYFRGPFHQCADTNVGYGWDAGENSTINYDAFRRDPADRQDAALYGTLRSYLNFDFMANDVQAQFNLKAQYLTPTEMAVEPFEADGYLTVGLHVRWDGMPGAEYLSRAEAGEFDPALHQPDIAYYDNAMNLMRKAYGPDKIRFLLASDDMAYVRAQSVFVDAPDVVFIEDVSPVSAWQVGGEQGAEEGNPNVEMIRDFAVLRRCQHMITSVGSFSWWAAYLGPYQTGGRVLYYDEWKRAHGEDGAYFPSEWIRVPEIPSEAETIVLPLEPTNIDDGESPYGNQDDLPNGVIAPEQQGEGASTPPSIAYGDAPDSATSAEIAVPTEDAPQDVPAATQTEDVVDISTPPSDAEGKILPTEEEIPPAPFDGVGVAYPTDGEAATVDNAASSTTGDEVPQDQPPQDQPIVEGETDVDNGDSPSTGLKGLVQGLFGGESSNEEAQETTAENMEEEPIDIAEERREAEIPSDEDAAAPDGKEAAEASEKSRRLGTEDMLRQAVQQEQEAEVAARRAAENDEPHKATLADADEMRRKAIRKMAMEQAAELARNRGIPTTPKAPDVLELQMPED